MNGNQSFLARRLFGAPLALHPQRADIARFGLSAAFEDMPPRSAALQGAAYEVIHGVAVIPVHGLLVHRLGCVGPWNGMTGYDGIRATVVQAANDRGLPELPMTSDAAARFQAEVDNLGRLMVETVARNRKLSTAKVAGQQAETYLGRKGVVAGLADMVAAPDVAMGALLDCLRPVPRVQLGSRT